MVKKIFPLIPSNPFRYNVWKLVNREIFADEAQWNHPLQIICDIDKTYLETNYETMRDMARILFETAMDKKTVDGAHEFLRALKFQNHPHILKDGVSIPLHFVSSSPPQLRAVLEHKIGMDHLCCASNSFKDQIYNLKKAKLSLLKHQVAYKVAAILSLCELCTKLEHLILIGDNAESDPYIYTLVKYILTSRLSLAHSISCLGYLGVPEDTAAEIFARLNIFENNKPSPQVIIAIRRVYPTKNDQNFSLARDIFWFEHYLHLTFIFHHLGYIKPPAVEQFIKESMKYSRLNPAWTLNQWQHTHHQFESVISSYHLTTQHRSTSDNSAIQALLLSLIDPQAQPYTAKPSSPIHLASDLELEATEFCAAFQQWVQSHLHKVDDRS